MLENLTLGFSVALSLGGLLYCLLGVVLGTVVGVLPGLGVMATLAILMPITFHLDAVHALIMLSGIYYGAAYGGSTASILLNLPGTANTAITCLDGYPMAQQGRAGVALMMTAVASFIGSILGLLILAFCAPILARVALNFGSPEYFTLMVLGLLAAGMLSKGSQLRSVAAIFIGLFLGIVGTDISTGVQRFTFDLPELYTGLPLVAISLGLFGLPEVIANAGRKDNAPQMVGKITMRSMMPTREDLRRSTMPMLRGSAIGSFFGALPGTGSLIASFASYVVEKKSHRDPSIFGHGAIEGITGPEAANNAATQTAFIPTLTLGVPGDAIMAMMLGVMLIHGVAPGPRLITEQPDLFWGLVASFLIGNVLLVILNIPLVGLWVRLLRIPYHMLFPAILVFICLGVYSVNYAVVDLVLVMAFGLVGYGMSLIRLEPAPLILGLVLGPMMEENLRRTLMIFRGDLWAIWDRPLSVAFLACSLALVVWSLVGKSKAKRELAADL
ncbi:tripartite tricarboxylate transporter permease [Sinirhodobacter sp. WL0062]|uniref:Tripartite tricarboxylate transporter permease n=1 Tax=Rhodobacter flavimaris TaxID=2907145 RepID=A0ABS8Z2C0_9RHOB|nr:tripartite tricarboxylate transporter permease [Sinirhodobacter sp. WL0062]MCE5975003.1 tripartite tricarboxylate transporter permease [Sinirhodobacter sp. WL0062]